MWGAIIGGGLALAQGVAGFMGQRRRARETERYNAQQTQEIQKNTRNQYSRLRLRQMQEADVMAEDSIDAQRELMKARSRAAVAAGEAGVAGRSVDRLLEQFDRQEERYLSRLRSNMLRSRNQIEFEIKGLQTTGQSQINSLRPPERPSLLGTALSTGAGVFDAYYRLGRSPSVPRPKVGG